MPPAYLRLLIFLPAILIPACASSSPAFHMMYSAYKLNKQGDNIQPWHTPSRIWNQGVVPCPVNCCFLTCIHISQEAGQVIWYSYLFRNFPQFVVIHTVKGFNVVNRTKVDVCLEFSCCFFDPTDAGNWSLVLLPFLNPAWTSGSSQLMYSWSLAWRILSIT